MSARRLPKQEKEISKAALILTCDPHHPSHHHHGAMPVRKRYGFRRIFIGASPQNLRPKARVDGKNRPHMKCGATF
jgi:hypothetical protein